MKTLLSALATILLLAPAAHAQPAPGGVDLAPPGVLFADPRLDPSGADAVFAGATLAGAPLLATEAEANARLEAIRLAVAGTPARSAIDVTYLPSASPALAPIHDAFAAGRYLDRALAVVAKELALPAPLRVVMADCGSVNAAYLNGRATLVVCHEVVAKFVDQFRPRYGADAAALGEAVVSATVFTTLHEVGHALIELLRLPVLGNEEDAADRIAAVYLLRDPATGAGRALAAADATGALASVDWDVHPFGAQRRYNVLCLTLGALNDPRLSAIGEDDFNDNRLPGCPAEFEAAKDALASLLRPWLRRAPTPRLDALRASGPPAADLNAPLAPPGGFADPVAEGLAYQDKVLRTLGAILANGGSADDCALYLVRYIKANQRGMSSLRAVLGAMPAGQRDALATKHVLAAFDVLSKKRALNLAHPDVYGLDVVRAFFEMTAVRG
ncbi:MAG: hypothetical protein KC635_23115 [Myxococcales bacterium]|nr:hypothetical protein [Myxococcales bacterium]MCB9732000.1 hypothetical protein [Deltaproteobacteria bacterium]